MPTRIALQIDDTRPFADGHAFGDVGAYERLKGKVLFAVDPAENTDIVDLGNCPRDAEGRVDVLGDASRLGDLHAPLRDRTHQADAVHVLERAHVTERLRARAADDDHGNARALRVGESRPLLNREGPEGVMQAEAPRPH